MKSLRLSLLLFAKSLGLNLLIALPAALELGKKYGVELPIIEGVHQIVDLGASPRAVVAQLMRRDPKPENWM